MKLAIDCRMIDSSGIGTYIAQLVPYFLKKYPCLLLGTHEQCMPYVRMENVEFCYCPVKPFSLQEMFHFPQDILAAINNCDVYYTPYCNIPGGITIPIISTIHDVVFLDLKNLTSFAGRMARKIIYQRAVNLSSSLVTVSEFSKSRILANLHCKKTVTVAYSSVPDWMKAAQRDRPATEKTDTILFVGNIKQHKGLSVLLKAFMAARAEGLSAAKLVIVGNADNFRTGDTKTTEQINALPEDAVRFTGKITDQELLELYWQAKLFVLPSFYEGFGLPPLEALTCGTNVILSDLPVFHEVYQNFPVTYFETGNAEDLKVKLLSAYNLPSPATVPDTYSFKKTAAILLQLFETAAAGSASASVRS